MKEFSNTHGFMQILPPEACSFHKEKWHILNNIVEN